MNRKKNWESKRNRTVVLDTFEAYARTNFTICIMINLWAISIALIFRNQLINKYKIHKINRKLLNE